MTIPILASIVIGILFLLYAKYLFSQTEKKRKEIGLTKDDGIKYADTEGIRALFPKVLYSKRFNLKGKPDMIILKDEEFIPIEYKPLQEKIYHSHIMQLVAYCILIEECYGKRPSHGVLVLKDNKKINIEFTNEKETELLNILSQMRKILKYNELPTDCFGKDKCMNCNYYTTCEEIFNNLLIV